MKWPAFLQRQSSAEPSLQELQKRARAREIAVKEPRWREEARELGLPEAEAKDPFTVLGALNRHHDETVRRPELEKRAAELGLDVSGKEDNLWSIVYNEEQRQKLMREERELAAAEQLNSPSL